MTEHEREILASIGEMAEQANGVGLCKLPFLVLREEVEKIIVEKNEIKNMKGDHDGK